MADVGRLADAASSQRSVPGAAPVAQAETKNDMPSALSDPDALPLPLSDREDIPSPLSDNDATHLLDHMPPTQHQVLRFQHVRLRINPPPETRQHYHTVDIELIQTTEDDDTGKRPPPVNLGKVFLGLTYQSVVAFMVFHFSSSEEIANLRHSELLSFLLNFSEVTVVVGFAASLVGVLIRELVSTKVAMVAEKVGSASAALGLFLMMSMFLSKSSIGIGWACGVVSFVAFVLVFMRMRKAG